MRLLLFNPDTDLALSTGRKAYTPKKGVEQMRRDLFPLMALFSRPGDALLLPSCQEESGLGRLRESLKVDLVREEDVSGLKLEDVVPWGWNLSVASRLSDMGVDERILPSGDFLEHHRRLSSRALLSQLSERFQGQEGLEAGSMNLESIKEVEALLDAPEPYVFKVPYSSSGKGLLWPMVLGRDLLLKRASQALRQGGLLTAQRVYDKVLDLAMEFFVRNRQASFTGYSVFKTNSRGIYEGNLCLSDALAESLIKRWIPMEWLHRARMILLSMLEEMDYEGPVGVDMMIARNPSKGCFLVPLLEMNLRHTMGMVSNRIHQRILDPSSAAFLSVQRFPSAGSLKAFHEKASMLSPLKWGPEGLMEGFLPLSLEDEASEFSASLTVISDATADAVSSFLETDL